MANLALRLPRCLSGLVVCFLRHRSSEKPEAEDVVDQKNAWRMKNALWPRRGGETRERVLAIELLGKALNA